MNIIDCLIGCQKIVSAVEYLSAFCIIGISPYLVSRSSDQAPKQRTNREECCNANKCNEDGLPVTLAPYLSSDRHLRFFPVILDETDDIEKLIISLKIDCAQGSPFVSEIKR